MYRGGASLTKWTFQGELKCSRMYEQLRRVTTPIILSSKPLVLKMSVIMYGIYKSCSLVILEFWCKLLKQSNNLISLISLLSLTKLKRLWLKKKLQKIFRTLTYKNRFLFSILSIKASSYHCYLKVSKPGNKCNIRNNGYFYNSTK